MNVNRLPDYLDHMRQAATDACAFVEGLDKADFLEDKRTQQAVIMSLIIIGEAANRQGNRMGDSVNTRSRRPTRPSPRA